MVYVFIVLGSLAFCASMIWTALNLLGVRDVFFPPPHWAKPVDESEFEMPDLDVPNRSRSVEWSLCLLFWPITLAWIVRDWFEHRQDEPENAQ